jgi:MerR family mercuric resistance operon transcriptional regulator
MHTRLPTRPHWQSNSPPRSWSGALTKVRNGQVAEAVGVNVQTPGYYRRRGRLAEPERSLGGHRLYPPDAVVTLRLIKAAQRLGLTLDQIADLLDAGRHRDGSTPDAGLQSRARAKLTEVETRLGC